MLVIGLFQQTTFRYTSSTGPSTEVARACDIITRQSSGTNQHDPEVEFLELGHSINGNCTWNLYGPDRSGTYGGAEGIGGLESGYQEATGFVYNTINNYFGDIVGIVAPTYRNPARYPGVVGGYGPMPGSDVNHDLEPQWRGHYLDITGFYYMGARYYNPQSGKFLSPDPLGRDANMDLYSYCNGDPVNGLDPDGRCVEGGGAALYDMGTGAYQLGKNVLGSAAYAATSGFGMFQNGMSDNFAGSWQGLQNTWSSVKYLGSQLSNGNFETVGVALTGGEGRSAGYRTGYAAVSLATMLMGGEVAGIGKVGEVGEVAGNIVKSRAFWTGADGELAAQASGAQVLKPSAAALKAADAGDWSLMRLESVEWARGATCKKVSVPVFPQFGAIA